MKIEMKLQNRPFYSIKSGTKTIEMRLYDGKRRKIKKDDIIEFVNIETNEKICVKVVKLYVFKNFEELYNNFNKKCLGYSENEIANSKDMLMYYSKEQQESCGVVGIEIKLI